MLCNLVTLDFRIFLMLFLAQLSFLVNKAAYGRTGLLAVLKSNDASSIMAAGRLRMMHIMTRFTGGWRLEERKLNSLSPSSQRST